MKPIFFSIALLTFWAGASPAADIPGDFEPQTRWECRCSCAALNLTQWVRVWDNVNRVYYYERAGVSLFESDALGEIYELRFPIGAAQSCGPYDGGTCHGLHRAAGQSQAIRLEGRYYRCRREVSRH
jgi:hypothetical protein